MNFKHTFLAWFLLTVNGFAVAGIIYSAGSDEIKTQTDIARALPEGANVEDIVRNMKEWSGGDFKATAHANIIFVEAWNRTSSMRDARDQQRRMESIIREHSRPQSNPPGGRGRAPSRPVTPPPRIVSPQRAF
ncbi:hypothetical protein K461DRAFT_268664 [Myriangium duriaei CBS 260.36]|uniref:Uncharacterized protein n=1 Tax=Myriangium duriaei CBS 260.36 TaxID=1168546 RepID=A0A9P4MFT5_9PEZI|nr:hypothetical protein K461DRAFT_268664 [Myriangium duriaei CBS 260.36]